MKSAAIKRMIYYLLIYACQAGIEEEEFDLTMTASGGGEIWYTTDGSDPTTGDTALLFTEAIQITDRADDANVVSAVDPLLISANFNNPGSSRPDPVWSI